MRISKAYIHSFGILLLFAKESPTGYMKSADMAERLEISESSLKKNLRALVVAGLLDSNASKDGGFKLAKPIEDITIADIVTAVEGPEIIQQPKENSKLFENIFGVSMPKEMPDFAYVVFDAIEKSELAILNILSQVSLADVYNHCNRIVSQSKENPTCALSS